MLYVNWNGKIVPEDDIIISPYNRSFRYGDGCFETIKVLHHTVVLKDLHFHRFFSSLIKLNFTLTERLSPTNLNDEILALTESNKVADFARVRLTAFRGDGALNDFTDNNVNYIIQCWPGSNASNFYNDQGLSLGFYNDAKKVSDHFSGIKSNNYLSSVMGAIWANKRGLDDCLLSNCHNRISEATIANVFMVADGIITTPSLNEGCVSGVMRRYLLNRMSEENIAYSEGSITPDELLKASEVFLTNANYGIRWVRSIRDSSYENATSQMLFKRFIMPLFLPATI